ncbi:MAG: 50S ribosomal protein L24 [Parachlamydiaceae bacterium]
MEKKPNQSTSKVRKGDRVVAVSGNDRGLSGTVQSRKGDKVVVQGLNLRKKHVKKSQEAPKGRIVEIERPIHVSNLKVCVEGDTAAKLKVRTNNEGDRELVYKQGGQEMVYRSVKKPK